MRYLLDLLFPPRADERQIRDLTIDDFLALLAPRLVDYTSPGTVALLPFHHPEVRSALHEAKYHGNPHAFALLAATLEAYLADTDEKARRTCIVPVPLGTARAQERGYNQVHEVAQRYFKTAGHPDIALAPDLLERTRETVSQVSLPREKRRENMRGAFGAPRPLDPTYLYIVIDDVITTGATLQAATDALTAAGAKHILPLALAH